MGGSKGVEGEGLRVEEQGGEGRRGEFAGFLFFGGCGLALFVGALVAFLFALACRNLSRL